MAIVGLDGPGKAMERILNALVGKPRVALDERGGPDHISVQDDGELSRLTLLHAEVPFFESGRERNTIVGAGGGASERQQCHLSAKKEILVIAPAIRSGGSHCSRGSGNR